MVIKRDKTPEYAQMCKSASAINENNDCTVKALAIAAGVNYYDAHDALAAMGRKKGKGAYMTQLFGALAKLGFEVTSVLHDQRIHNSSRPTTGTICNYKFIKDRATYLVQTSQHVAAIKDKTVHDYTNGRKFQVKAVWQLWRIK